MMGDSLQSFLHHYLIGMKNRAQPAFALFAEIGARREHYPSLDQYPPGQGQGTAPGGRPGPDEGNALSGADSPAKLLQFSQGCLSTPSQGLPVLNEDLAGMVQQLRCKINRQGIRNETRNIKNRSQYADDVAMTGHESQPADAGDANPGHVDHVVRLSSLRDDPRETMILDDYINLAQRGDQVSVHVDLEYVPAIEHFEYHQNHQTFLLADFTVTAQGKTSACQRCLGCYQTEKEPEEKPLQIEVANDRLSLIYKEFDQSSIGYEKRFFA